MFEKALRSSSAKSGVVLSALLLCFTDVNAQFSRGTVHEDLTVKSEILGRDVSFSVYLPYDYETSTRLYPVTYLLHGYTDDDSGWIQFGQANILADKAIAQGAIPAMVLAMPDGGLSYYINNHDGSEKYEDFFVREFIPHIEKTYRVRAQKRYRGISGLSMGGHGALLLAMKHPDIFAAAAAFSAAVYTDEQTLAKSQRRWDAVEGSLYGSGATGQDRLTEHYYDNNPIYRANSMSVEQLRKVRWYIDCGDDDYLATGNANLHITFHNRQVPHEYRVRDGGHRWSYWRDALIPGLTFIGESFRQ